MFKPPYIKSETLFSVDQYRSGEGKEAIDMIKAGLHFETSAHNEAIGSFNNDGEVR